MMKLNKKAVSTALASVMLLSLVVAMTAGVYVLTTQSVNAVAPVSKAAFEKGESVASEFTATIEEGGLGTKAVMATGDYEYGDIKDLVLSIQKSASYVKNVPGYFRVILQNPTSKVVKVPELKVSMKDPNDQKVELSESIVKDITVAARWGDANPIGFTPEEAGDYVIRIEVYDEGGEVVKDLNAIAAVSSLPESITAEGGELNGKLTFTSIEESVQVKNYNETVVTIPLKSETKTIELEQLSETFSLEETATPSQVTATRESGWTYFMLKDSSVPYSGGSAVSKNTEYTTESGTVFKVVDKILQVKIDNEFVNFTIYEGDWPLEQLSLSGDRLSWKSAKRRMGVAWYLIRWGEVYQWNNYWLEGRSIGAVDLKHASAPRFSFNGFTELSTCGRESGQTVCYYHDSLPITNSHFETAVTYFADGTYEGQSFKIRANNVLVYEGKDTEGGGFPGEREGSYTLNTLAFKSYPISKKQIAIAEPTRLTYTKQIPSEFFSLVLDPVEFTGDTKMAANLENNIDLMLSKSSCQGGKYSPKDYTTMFVENKTAHAFESSYCSLEFTAFPHVAGVPSFESSDNPVKQYLLIYPPDPDTCGNDELSQIEGGIEYKLCNRISHPPMGICAYQVSPTFTEKITTAQKEETKSKFGESRVYNIESGNVDYQFDSYYFDGTIGIDGTILYTETKAVTLNVPSSATTHWIVVDIEDGLETLVEVKLGSDTLYRDVTGSDLVLQNKGTGAYSVKVASSTDQTVSATAYWYEPAEFELDKHPLLDTYDYYYTLSEKADISATSEYAQATSFEEETTGDPVTLRITNLESSKILPDGEINVTIKVPYPFNVTFDGGSTQYTTAVSMTPEHTGVLYTFHGGETQEYLGIPSGVATKRYTPTNANEYPIYYKSRPQTLDIVTYSNKVSTSGDVITIAAIQPPNVIFDLKATKPFSSSTEYVVPEKMSTITLNDVTLTTSQPTERIVELNPSGNEITASFTGGTTDVYLFGYYSTSVVPVQNSGKTGFTVDQLATGTLGDCWDEIASPDHAVTECEESRVEDTLNYRDSPSNEYTTTFSTRDVAIGKARTKCGWQSGRADFSGFLMSGRIERDGYSTESMEEEYAQEAGHHIDLKMYHTHGGGYNWESKGVHWDAEGVAVSVNGQCNYLTYTHWLTGFNTPSTDLRSLTKNVLAVCGGKTLENGYESAGQICSCLDSAKTWSLSEGASYTTTAGLSGAVKPDELTCVKGDTFLYAPLGTNQFTLEDKKIINATLYLVPSKDFTVKVRLNNELLTEDWLQLSEGKRTTIDITDVAIPGAIGNKLEIWIDPEIGIGEYSIDWNVQVE